MNEAAKRERVARIFNDSLERCLTRKGFLEAVYERFAGASDEIAALFAPADAARQRRMMKAALFLCATAYAVDAPEARVLRAMGRRHRGYGIRPGHYELWLSVLCEVASEYDSNFDHVTVAAWETALRRGIELMKEGHTRRRVRWPGARLRR